MNQLALQIDNTKHTQCDDLLDYLDRHGSITFTEALSRLGIGRLAARIYDLEQRGYTIPRRMVRGKARNGRRYAVTEYRKPNKEE